MIPEDSDENIREKAIKALSKFLEWDGDYIEAEIDKAYKIKTRCVKLRKVPKDVLVHFVMKKTRDQVVQNHYNTN